MVVKHILFAAGIALCAGVAGQAVQALRSGAGRLDPLGIVAVLCVAGVAAFKEAAILWPVPRDLAYTISTSHWLRHPALWMLIAGLIALALYAALLIQRRKRGTSG